MGPDAFKTRKHGLPARKLLKLDPLWFVFLRLLLVLIVSAASYKFCLVSGFRMRILRSVATTKHPAHSATFSF